MCLGNPGESTMSITYHHDDRSYADALSETAQHMHDKLHARIEQGRDLSQKAIERIFAEVPQDKIVRDAATAFRPNAENTGIDAVYAGEVVESLHVNALSQMAEHAGVPRNYLTDLGGRGAWGQQLAADNLSRIFAHSQDRHLVRSIGSQTRGFLSTKYRRLDPRMLLEAFMASCSKAGALPYEAVATDTKWMVRAVLPMVVEPIKDEVLFLGVTIAESAYGRGATEVSPWVERAWCTNLAVTETQLRRVHIGNALGEGISWSDETIQADSKLTSLQISDLVGGELGESTAKRLCETVVAAHERKIDARRFEDFLKKNLSKEEVTGVMDSYRSADVEMLPAGNTVWRASNALSWFAHSVTEPERRFEINKLAGAVMNKAAA
jgi:hypothetical protein